MGSPCQIQSAHIGSHSEDIDGFIALQQTVTFVESTDGKKSYILNHVSTQGH